MRPTLPATLLFTIITTFCMACGGEEEEPTPPAERCQADNLKVYLTATVDDGSEQQDFQISNADGSPGWIGFHEIRINLGNAVPPEGGEAEPVILRLYDPASEELLGSTIDNLTDEAPVEVAVFDASEIPAGAEDVTSLSEHECSLAEGTICAQIGFDSAGDNILFDDDEFVYNAVGGSVIFEGFDPVSRTFSVKYDLDLGRNILRFQDESTGRAEGCLLPRYTAHGGEPWVLE